MASCYAWLSVLLKRNHQVLRPWTVVKCSCENTFGMLLGKFDMTEVTIEKVEIYTNEKFLDAHIVPIDGPVSLAEQFKCHYVSQSSDILRVAAKVLMDSSQQVVFLAPVTTPEGKKLRNNHKMYNDILCKFCCIFTDILALHPFFYMIFGSSGDHGCRLEPM